MVFSQFLSPLCLVDGACRIQQTSGGFRSGSLHLRPSLLCLHQGIERLKGETGKWGKVPCWKAMQIAFGGPFSLSWCSPFSKLTCKKSPQEEHAAIPQGEIIEEDVIEIPFD